MNILIGYFVYIIVIATCCLFSFYTNFGGFDFLYLIPALIFDYIAGSGGESYIIIVWFYCFVLFFYTCVYFLLVFIIKSVVGNKRED